MDQYVTFIGEGFLEIWLIRLLENLELSKPQFLVTIHEIKSRAIQRYFTLHNNHIYESPHEETSISETK